MCGIAGYINPGAAPEERQRAVGRMLRHLPHRGPDGGGLFSHGPVTLGARRLAIFDPARGQQPMRTPDGRFQLVFNGAIYNHRTLRRELQARGHAFQTDCDTEVLLAAWAEWQENALHRLRGMFAFAIWDAAQLTLTLARDPFGIKPLYVRSTGRDLVFASELNALVASRIFHPTIDVAAADAYLAYLAVPAPQTIYAGVTSLRPGECVTWRAGEVQCRETWRFPASGSETTGTPSAAEFRAALRSQLEDSVGAHLQADVPVGAFLSGGLDSAAIVGLMRRHASGPLRTFTLAFPEAERDEAAAAAETARHFATEHHTIPLTGGDVAIGLDAFVQSLDQPSGDALNTYFIARAARAGGVTVALSGLGADELFGGYRSFATSPQLVRALRWWHRTPRRLRESVRRHLNAGSARRRKIADLLGTPATIHDVALHRRQVLSSDVRRALLRSTEHVPSTHPELARLPIELAGCVPEAAVSAWELRTYLADVLLRDSDVMSMAHSLELRVPFVDRSLIEWLWRQPAHFRFTPDAPKSALAEALIDVLPSSLRSRPKQGFTLPLDQWMRRDLRPFLDGIFSPASVERTGILDQQAAATLWRSFLAGRDSRQWSRVWCLAILIAFINRPRPA